MSKCKANPHLTHHDSAMRQKSPTLLLIALTSGIWLSDLTLSGIHLAQAAPPLVGTIIENQATGSFTNPSDGSTQQIESNTVTVTVAEVAGINISQTGTPTEAPITVSQAGSNQGDGKISPGDVAYFEFTITNVGNDPTQFVIPSAPASITNGSFVAANPIQVIEYNDGTVATPLNIAVTAATATGNLTGFPNGGSIPVGGTVKIQVPVKIDATAAIGDTVQVVIGDTPPDANNSTQNQPYAAGNQDVYTQDNNLAENGDTTGNPLNGERETSSLQELELEAPNVDYGDAPDSYGTLGVNNGARHILGSGLLLGTAAGTDTDGFVDGVDDSNTGTGGNASDSTTDDGVKLGTTPLQGQSLTQASTITLTITTAGTAPANQTGQLNAWVDWDGNGIFDVGEAIAVNVTDGGTDDQDNTAGNNQIQLDVPVPANAQPGLTFVRFRYSTESDLEPTGLARDGEVEDYQVTIAAIADLSLTKTVDNLAPNVGDEVVFTLTVSNSGPSNATGVEVTDALPIGLEFVSDDSNGAYNPGTDIWTVGSIANGGTQILKITAKVTDAIEIFNIAEITKSDQTDSDSVPNNYDPNNPNNPNPTDEDDNSSVTLTPKTYTISGSVYNDKDGSGTLQDGTEPLLPNVTVILYKNWTDTNTNGLIEPSEATVVATDPDTNADGNYSLNNIPSGNYFLQVETSDPDLAANLAIGTPNPLAITVQTQDLTDQDFGFSTLVPNVLLIKRITALNGSTETQTGESLVTYINDPTNPYDDNVIDNPASTPAETTHWPDPSSFLLGGIDGGFVAIGDDIEYTIYFLSDGNTTASNVLLCDRVPDFLEFDAIAFNNAAAYTPDPNGISTADRNIALKLGNNSAVALTGTADGDVGYYFPTNTDPANTFPGIQCGGENTNGAVVVNLGNIPAAGLVDNPPANNSYGFIRFRGQIVK